MAKATTKKYRPAQFVPSTSYTGDELPLILWGENMWIRFGRFGSVYAEGYKGSKDTGDAAIPTKTMTGTWSWTAGSKIITGQGGVADLYSDNVHEGQWILGDGGASAQELFVVDKVIDKEHFSACQAPTSTQSGKTARILPVIFPVGIDRGTAISGNVIRFLQGNFLGVGDGEFRLNGASLSAAFNLSRKPRFALKDPVAGTYTQDDVGIALPTPEPVISLSAIAGSTQMQAGAYNVRVMARNTRTKGYSNPSAVQAPVTLAAGDAIVVTFNRAMVSDQDAWDVYCTPFDNNSDAATEPRYMGPWYFVRTLLASDLIDGGHPTGREAGTSHSVFFSDGEIVALANLLSFDNFLPEDALFVDLINGIPIFFSCDGPGDPSHTTTATCPGPTAIPMKPSNPEGAFLDKSLSMANGDTIIGEIQIKGRIFAMGLETLQNIILTTLDTEPIAFRALWNVGFRNPYALAAIKEYLYGMSTGGIIRSVAGGDDTETEFDFASDVFDLVSDWNPGHVLVQYDPKNKAMIFFLACYEKRSGHWVTLALPFLIDKGVFNPPMILAASDRDFIVCGAATVGQELIFLAGGRKDDGTTEIKTYVFDGGDSSTKQWNMCWAYTDDGSDLMTKRVKGVSTVGLFNDVSTAIKIYGVSPDGEFKYSDLRAGTNPDVTKTIGASGTTNVRRTKFARMDGKPFPLYAARIEGQYTTSTRKTVDRLDEVIFKIESNSTEM